MIKQARVAVVMGGNSAEREISIKSGTAVHRGLINEGVNAELLDVTADNLRDLNLRDYDVCFIALHGRGGEDGSFQGYLETIGLPYTGSRVQASAIAMDKGMTKDIWFARQLPTPAYSRIRRDDNINLDSANRIMASMGTAMVKPAHEGSSIGMAKVDSGEALLAALNDAFRYDGQVVVEQFITGEEYTVAIVDKQALPPIRLKTPNTFYDFEAKYQSGTTEYLCPCGLSEKDTVELSNLALKAFLAIGCTGWGRVDVMRDQEGKFWLLEVNTVPGMTEKSLVPMAAKAQGITFDELVCNILETATL
jgi:D-alanine-D-alanine ligase